MDELEISGKRYISSRRAAKENHYHTDYIGQLIRAKKIIGSKVGRAWYVEEESLKAYLNQEAPKVEVSHSHTVHVEQVRHIPVQEAHTAPRPLTIQHAPQSLRYITDDEPPIYTQKSIDAQDMHGIQEVQEAAPAYIESKSTHAEHVMSAYEIERNINGSKRNLVVAVVIVAGLIAFAGAAYASIFGSTKVVIEQGKVQSANVLSF